MNKVIGHLGDKFSIYLLVFIIGALLLYYAFGYVPHNQLLLDNYGMRVLDSKALAISDKYKGYDNAVSSAPISYLSKWFFFSNPEENCLFLKEDFSGAYYSSEPLQDYRPITKTDFVTKARVDPNLIPVKRGPERKAEIKRIWRDDRGSSYFNYTPSVSFYNGQSPSAEKEKDRKYPLLRTKISDFTANLKENDFFEDIFLVRAHKCQDCNNDPLQEEIAGYGNFILDESKLGLVEFNLNDSAKNASSGIYQSTFLGKQYKVYYKMIKLRRGLDVYAVGLIPLDVFKAEAKQVSVWFLVFCSLGALLLVFLFPVLKLFLLSEGERLSTRDISFGVFSMMLCACLCFILSIGFYFFWGLEMERNDEDIKQLAKEISSKAKEELCTLREALKNKAIFSKQKIDTTTFKSLIGDYDFNEIFLLESTGFMKSIYRKMKKSQDAKKIEPPDLELFPVTVAERNYFKAIRENGRLDYFLQSINSFASGNSEVAISAPIECDGQNEYIGVVTTPLQSILQACVPSPYKFVFLDDKGDVKFHSSWNQIKSENFLSELENYKHLDTYLKNAISDHVDFTYLRHECRGYTIPVEKNWSVLVYYEKSEIYNMSAQIFIMCLISLFIVVLFCMVLHLLLRADRYNPVLLKTAPFMYAWLNPNNFDQRTWWYLFRINFWILASEVLGLWALDSFVSTLLFSLMTITSAYALNYLVLGPKPFSNPLIHLFLVMGILMVFFLAVAPDVSWLLCMPILACIAIVTRHPRKEKLDLKNIPKISDREKAFLAYRCFMISWLTIVIMGPAVGFLVRHYEHEKLMITYASLIADVQKVREKMNTSAPDVKELPPYYLKMANYVQKAEPVKSPRCERYDSVYYNQLPQFTFLNGDNTPLQFNYVPDMRDVVISRYGKIVEVSANTNKLGMSGYEIKRQSQVKGAEVKFNRSTGFSAILVVGLAILFWWVLTTLTQKIFHLPKHAAWKTLPPPEFPWGNIKFEFTNAEDGLHLMKGVGSKIKAESDALDTNSLERWEHEKLILELQHEQNDLYTLYWNQCTEDEKFFLYDLSEDGVVNHPDDEVLKALSQKKLLRLFPRLEIVNVSFTNFVRTTLQKDEIQKMERQESKDGRWKHTRVSLIIIIIAALAFLSIAEENFFGRATAVIGSIALLLPNLMTLLGSITRLFTKSSTPASA
jgi:hypothetical protein